MATVEANYIFHESVDRIFQGWTVLQLAVQHGFGGQYSREKAVWMVEAVCNWFQENNDIEPQELGDYIASLLDNEFECRAEDGSLEQISTDICGNYNMCRLGQESLVAQKLAQLPKADISGSRAEATVDNLEDECMDDSNVDEHNVHAMMNGLELGSTSVHESEVTEARHENPNSTELTNNESYPTDGDDGWTMVRKPRKK